MAARCKDGTVIAWSYPSGKILFQMKEHKESFGIKWNPFRQDVFAASHRVRNAVNSLFHSPVSYLFIYLEAEGKLYINNLIVSTSLSFFSSFLFLIFQFEKTLLLWNTRANGDATKENLFYTLERDMNIRKVEWIFANRIALGFMKGFIEIWEIDEEETTNSRVIKQFKHGNVSLRI